MIKLTAERLRNAIKRARQLRPRVTFIAERMFSVQPANSGNRYTVRFEKRDGEKFGECDCKAGQNEMPCYHLASALAVNIGVMNMRRAVAA